MVLGQPNFTPFVPSAWSRNARISDAKSYFLSMCVYLFRVDVSGLCADQKLLRQKTFVKGRTAKPRYPSGASAFINIICNATSLDPPPSSQVRVQLWWFLRELVQHPCADICGLLAYQKYESLLLYLRALYRALCT